jgi:hypothetical protein
MTPQQPPNIIQSRALTHGDWATRAQLCQLMQNLARNAPNYDGMYFGHREAIDMIIVKLSRILCGDPNHPDHWRDIIGYAELALNGCKL